VYDEWARRLADAILVRSQGLGGHAERGGRDAHVAHLAPEPVKDP
jgi:hypothetical protein